MTGCTLVELYTPCTDVVKHPLQVLDNEVTDQPCQQAQQLSDAALPAQLERSHSCPAHQEHLQPEGTTVSACFTDVRILRVVARPSVSTSALKTEPSPWLRTGRRRWR
jgi:hypothetical protein